MERTLPARTARAASQVVAQAGLAVGKCGRGAVLGAGLGDAAGVWAKTEREANGREAAAAAMADCWRNARRGRDFFMRNSVKREGYGWIAAGWQRISGNGIDRRGASEGRAFGVMV